mgnify:CR=1 FL=1
MDLFNCIWENGLISFDTSSMGRMYEWEYNQAINIKDAVSYLYQTNRLWESNINVIEFSRQRKLIKDSIYDTKYVKGIFKNLNKKPIPWNKIEGTLGRWEKSGFAEEFVIELLKLKDEKSISNEAMNKIEQIAVLTSGFPDLESLFDKILSSDEIILSEQEKTNAIKRFDSGEICPGCQDRNKNNGNKYNDLFIWELLKKKSRIANKNFIFVTVDVKDDWYYNGKPRKEYIEEFEAETGHKILILSLIEFWKECKQYLDVSVEDFIELSTIKNQLERKYDDKYEEQIFEKIESLIFESEKIKDILEDLVDCCVDMTMLEELEENRIGDIDILNYDEEFVYVLINIESEGVFVAQNHTCGEDWSPGDGNITLGLQVNGRIPIKWSSEDTHRMVLDDYIFVDDIIDIEVISHISMEDYYDDDYVEEYGGYEEDYEYDDYFSEEGW